MQFRKYGDSGIEVSEIGMGGMRFGNDADIDASAAIVKRAYDKGIRYFDTAPFYNNDRSEIIFGHAIKELKKEKDPFHIATKTNVSDGKEVRPQLERSLERLGLDAIDFYHVWCLVHPGQLEERKKNGVLDAFRKAKEEGLIRHICVSTHLVHEEIAPMLEQGEDLFEGMLIGFNALNFTMRMPGVRAAADRGLGVVTMNTLGGGLMTDHPDQYAGLKEPGDTSMLDVALRFNLSFPEVSCALVGFRTEEDVDTAMAAYERVKPYTPSALEAFMQRATPPSEKFCTQCNYCAGCPVDIPVLRIMEAYNHKILHPQNPKVAINRLRFHWGIPELESALEACTECGHCEEVCTQHLPILQRFDELKEDARAAKN